MFNNNNNNKSENKKNVNTRSFQFYNKEGFDPSTLVLGFWNDFLSIKLHPAKDPSKQTETDIFDYEKAINTALNPEKALALLTNIQKVIYPALAAGECRVVGVPVGGNNIITVSTIKVRDGKIVPALGIFKGLNDNRIPEITCHYEFKATQLIDEYNAQNGDYQAHSEFIELDLFVAYLKSGISSMTNAFTHSYRHVEHYGRSREIENWKMILAHFNLQSEGYSGGGYRRGGSNPFGGSGSNKSSSQIEDAIPEFGANVDSISSLDELSF